MVEMLNKYAKTVEEKKGSITDDEVLLEFAGSTFESRHSPQCMRGMNEHGCEERLG